MEILSIITSIRNSFEGSVEIYTKGSCYKFYEILKSIFPDAEAYYDHNHVITKIDGKFYDITGEVQPNELHIPFENHGVEVKEFYAEHKYPNAVILILKNDNGLFWQLVTPNGSIVLTSLMFHNVYSVKNNIETVKNYINHPATEIREV